jgi:hypothetical protein
MTDNAFDDDLSFGLDTTGVDEESLYTGGGGVNKDGKYHVICVDVANDTKEGGLTCVKLTLQVLDGTEKDQVEKKHFHRLYFEGWEDKANGVKKSLDENARKRLARFARAFNVLTEKDMDNPDARINARLFSDKQAVVEIAKGDDYTDKDGNKKTGKFEVPWNNAWPLNHADVEDVPKDPEYLAMMGGIEGGGGGDAAGDDDDLSDI